MSGIKISVLILYGPRARTRTMTVNYNNMLSDDCDAMFFLIGTCVTCVSKRTYTQIRASGKLFCSYRRQKRKKKIIIKNNKQSTRTTKNTFLNVRRTQNTITESRQERKLRCGKNIRIIMRCMGGIHYRQEVIIILCNHGVCFVRR